MHTATDIVRSQIWLEDGNVVLQAEGTQFKLHRGTLSLNSTIFKDMFSLPQPTFGAQLVEGCPVVRLLDSATDLSYVLQALCQRRYVTVGEPLRIEVIAAFLRLGSKYEIETLRAEALRRLFYEFPAELDDNDSKIAWSMIKYEKWVTLDVIHLAREQNLLSVLPLALLQCCSQYTVQEIVEGVRRGNDELSSISSDDKHVCFLAYRRLLELQGETTFSWVKRDSSLFSLCSGKSRCANLRKSFLYANFFPVATIRGLDNWKEDWGMGMCDRCRKVDEESHVGGRKKLWDALPGVFALPKWEELKKERATQ